LTDELKGEEKPPIGRPIGNVRVYVLDKQQRPVPVGVVGELYIGGMGVARGYQNRAEMSAEKFIPDAYSEEGGERLYRTGDWVRYVKGGKLEYVGRIDEQVKVRGFRIELGEIEAALRQHPSVREAAAVARNEETGEARLVAYVVAQRGKSLMANELRAHLRERLPEYMIPALFVTLDEMPLTPNGKIDRRALPSPEGLRPELGKEYVAPRDATEEVLAGIWGQILQVEKVGINDNYFDLGGDSLMAMQLISRMSEVFQVKLQVNQFFEAPSVEEMAEVIHLNEAVPGQTEKIARVLRKIQSMSQNNLRELLEEKRRANQR
jgi:acyl carrier protein